MASRRTRLSPLVTGASVAVIAALVLTTAVISGGYAAQRLELGDASVWVANGAEQLAGRANTEILRLNSVVEGSGSELAVVQDGRTVLLVDQANTRVDVVDPASSQVTESVALPPESPWLALAGDTVVIVAGGTGEVWLVPLAELANFDVTAEPGLVVGAGAALSVTPEGVLHAFSSASGLLYRMDVAGGSAVRTRPAPAGAVDAGGLSARWALSVVGETVVLLEQTSRRLWVEGAAEESVLGLGGVSRPVLQSPGPPAAAALVAFQGGLLSVPLDGSAPSTLVRGRAGTPAAPLVQAECAFAAWADGQAWRSCAGQEPRTLALAGMSGAGQDLGFARNEGRVLLNDAGTGGIWAVQGGGEAINNWSELIRAEENQQQIELNDADAAPEFEKAQMAPVAIDDEFGARPGRATVLPVLLNDYDPNGDVLLVSEVTGLDASLGRLELVRDRQQVQLILPEGASGELSFGYTVTDGRGGSASATVRVSVRAPGENSPPEQVRPSRTVVAEGGRVTSAVLGDWVDPDGDAFYLTAASTASPDRVSHKPEGSVVFQEGGVAGTQRAVSLVVSDGTAEATGSLTITVGAPGEVPLIADPFVVRSYAGATVRVSPLEHVRGGTGTLRLSGVPSKTGATIVPNLDSGRFSFTSDEVRTFFVDYVATDGSQTVTGLVRIEVEAPPDANSRPITIPKTVFVKTLSSETLDVASLDTDPAGGVLLVTGVLGLEPAEGVRADILDQRYVRVTLLAPLEHGPIMFRYTVTNGLAEAEGIITVIEIPAPELLQAPVASDDSVTVRVGDTIDIPVLDNDLHPDGEELTLSPTLTENVGAGGGLLFASGRVLRYLAPTQTGNFTAVYEVAGPDGQTSQAQVRVAVREVVEASNAPPAPATVIARVFAGETVSIRIPLTGIDPDGDSVQLLGQESNPEKGAVTRVGTDVIEYQAGDYSAGTDRFRYTVIDSLGARASGVVRVGISPAVGGARNPVATADEVLTRPGGTVAVQVLANDSDPDGGALHLVSVDPNSADIEATIVGDVIEVTPPREAGRYGLVYTIENDSGGSSSNFLTVIVDPDAPRARPLAVDSVLTLSDILGRDTVTIDVLSSVFFADGPVSSLGVSLLPGYSATAEVLGSKSIEVRLGDRRQIIPFAVTHPDDPTVVAYAFIRVPGFEDALPQLDRNAPALTVASESRLVIDLNKYVVAVGGKRVRLTDAGTVQATHGNGDKLVIDHETLVYTSADKYFGPASISFEVTDGATADAEGAHTATLVLPITVTPRENQPPVFTGGSIEFEPGEEKILDLLKLTTYPYPDDVAELTFRVLEPLPVGFSYTLSGSILTLRAAPGTPKGSVTDIVLGVRDAISEGQAGTIALRVVASSRPLARPAPDTAITPRGKSTVIDVLANDTATNPFPGQPLRVVAIRGLDSASLPAGVTVVPSAEQSRLTVTVGEGAVPGDTQLQYQVSDATDDPDRYVWGTVTLSVQDVPDAPSAPTRVGGHANGVLTLRITPPAFNNAQITRYEIISSSNGDYRRDCGLQQLCTLDDLEVGKNYEFRVVATNSIGASEPGSPSVPLRVDHLPAAPAAVTAAPSAARVGELVIAWAAVPSPQPGTPVIGYTVRLSGPGVGSVDLAVPAGQTSLTTTASGLIQPGQVYQAVVFARNSAQVGVEDWIKSSPASVTAVGLPGQVAALSAVVLNAEGHIRVSWQPGGWNGRPGGSYQVARFDEGASGIPGTCVSGGPHPGAPGGDASGWIDTAVTDGARYVYVIYADNGLFCSVTVSGPVESMRPPGQAGFSVTVEHQSGGYYDARVSGLGVASGTAVRYEYTIGGDGVWRSLVGGQFVTSSADASVYGTSVTIAVRACRDASADFCGPASGTASVIPVATRASVPGCTPSEPFTPSRPLGSAAYPVSYAIDYALDGVYSGVFTAYTAGDLVPETATGLRIKASVTVAGHDFVDPEYGETVCQPAAAPVQP